MQDPERVQQSVERIERLARTASSLVEDIVDLGRADAGILELLLRTEPASKVVADAVEAAGPQAAIRRVTIAADVAQVADAAVSCDARRVQQIEPASEVPVGIGDRTPLGIGAPRRIPVRELERFDVLATPPLRGLEGPQRIAAARLAKRRDHVPTDPTVAVDERMNGEEPLQEDRAPAHDHVAWRAGELRGRGPPMQVSQIGLDAIGRDPLTLMPPLTAEVALLSLTPETTGNVR